jgi:C4-dicarboxylate-specific signal transduction histidine kinase
MHSYVAERLRHRLRNSMLGAQVHASQLRGLVQPEFASDAQDLVAKLNDSMLSLAHELEATEVCPEHFEERSIVLFDWIKQMNERYAARYRPVRLMIEGHNGFHITASDYLLEITFWNIWLNAQQAVGVDCQIRIHAVQSGNHIHLLISDNGPGFPAGLAEIAFEERYSLKHANRGRGLLEIQEAVKRLGGKVHLTETSKNEYRMKLSLPLECK